jgi:hypothetical protein
MNHTQMPMQMQCPQFQMQRPQYPMPKPNAPLQRAPQQPNRQGIQMQPDRTRNRYLTLQRNLRMVRRTKEVKIWGPVSSVA